MNMFRLCIYWFLVMGLILAHLIRRSRVLTRLCLNASMRVWPDFYEDIHRYATRSTSGMTRAEFKQRFGHEMAAIINISNGFNIEWFSPKLVKFVGLTPDELNSLKQVATLIHRDDLEQFTIKAQRWLTDKEISTATYRIITKSGDLRWISLSSWGSSHYVFSVARDITAQEKIKQYPN